MPKVKAGYDAWGKPLPPPDPKPLTVGDLIDRLGQYDRGLRVRLSIGGDGATHSGFVTEVYGDEYGEEPVVGLS